MQKLIISFFFFLEQMAQICTNCPMILKIQIQYKFVESALILTLAQSAKTFGTKEELEV